MTLNPQLPQTISDVSGLREWRPVALPRLQAGGVDKAMSRGGPVFLMGLVALSTTMNPEIESEQITSLVWSVGASENKEQLKALRC